MANPQLVDADVETPAEDPKLTVAKPKAVKKTAAKPQVAAMRVESETVEEIVESVPEIDPTIFVFTPTIGDDRNDILLPLDFSKPDFNDPLDRIWLFDLGDLPPHERMWVWLRRAQVPRMTAHRVVALPLDEQVRCIENWLSAAQGVGAGE